MALKVLFLVFPLASAVAVQAYDCESFDDGKYWLRADWSLQCGSGDEVSLGSWTAEYWQVRTAAIIVIIIYPVGVPLFFLLLLLSCRKQLSRRAASTPLSTALGFLHTEYRKRFLAWEVLESLKKLFFVSLIRMVAPGSLSQLLVALVVALSLLVVQLTSAPYKLATDNFLGLLSSIAYVLLLLGSLTIKIGSLFSALGDQLSPQLRQASSVPDGPLLLVLLASTLTSIVFSTAVLMREALRAWRQPKMRYTISGAVVFLPLPPGKSHHLFISHVWGSGQDQARVLRSRLQVMVPGLRVWLDVCWAELEPLTQSP